LTLAAAVLGAVAAIAGPLAYAADTITTAHTGSIPSAGPANAAGMGIGGRVGAPGGGGGTRPAGFPGGGGAGTGATSGVPGLFGTSVAGSSSGRAGKPRAGGPTGAASGLAGGGGGGSTKTSAALVKALQSDAARYRWVAATSGSQSAATLELASDEPVMGIGGFNNEGGRLTLAAFKAYVAKGEIHYYIASAGGAGGGPGGGAGGSSTSAITSWVQAHYTAETIGGQTVYNLA
jgi:hypothetical protein